MPSSAICAACGASCDADAVERAAVPCNVRRFLAESFIVWRCPRCRSLHARDDVDLDHYYRDYPFHSAEMAWVTRLFYRVLTRRLKRCGLRRDMSLLDYGCGKGLYVQFLTDRDYQRISGYDAYAPAFCDEAVLQRRYDMVFSQDVLEHVADPRELLNRFDELAQPGGRIVVGTPDASHIDLSRADFHRHSLHQPYHRHILSREALLDIARSLGWRLERWYDTPYVNTPAPFINVRSWLRYARSRDNTLDLAFEPFRPGANMLTPAALFDGLFGALRCPRADILAAFRKPQ
ncbi:MAG: class I SAM-dependent methyltransferase [Phycisphaerales bacterium]|nr:class I SAM-dependent methyltransferase [Phycisphaerales bacterium]